MTTADALAFALMCVKAVKKQAIEKEEKFNQEVIIPVIQDMEKELSLIPSIVDSAGGILFEDERPDVKFDHALNLLEYAYNKFEEFESDIGEETEWTIQEAD